LGAAQARVTAVLAQDALAGVEVFRARERSLMELRVLHNPGTAEKIIVYGHTDRAARMSLPAMKKSEAIARASAHCGVGKTLY